MNIDDRLKELQDFATRNATTWAFTGNKGEYWGFTWLFRVECRVILTVTPLGFCVRTHDRIHTTAGQEIETIMRDVDAYFLDRYGPDTQGEAHG